MATCQKPQCGFYIITAAQAYHHLEATTAAEKAGRPFTEFDWCSIPPDGRLIRVMLRPWDYLLREASRS